MISNIPLKSLPNQSMRVEVTFDDKKQFYILNFNFNEVCGYWCMTIKDTYENVLLSNIPLVTGNSILEAGNLLKQFAYKKLGSIMVLKSTNTKNDIPDEKQLGQEFKLIWADTEVKFYSEGQVEKWQ